MNVKYDGPPQDAAGPRSVLVIEAIAESTYEDDRRAAIAEVSTRDIGPFVRILEWNEGRFDAHELVPGLDGKRVRVTVEVLE